MHKLFHKMKGFWSWNHELHGQLDRVIYKECENDVGGSEALTAICNILNEGTFFDLLKVQWRTKSES